MTTSSRVLMRPALAARRTNLPDEFPGSLRAPGPAKSITTRPVRVGLSPGLSGILLAGGMLAWLCHLASPDTRLIDVAMITAPSGNDSHACRSAVRRICLDLMSVSETWNVMPIVKDR